MTLYERINKLNMNDRDKDGYCWLICNFKDVQREVRNAKTIGDVRKKCYKFIGFAPALLFSAFKNDTAETYVEKLEKSFTN